MTINNDYYRLGETVNAIKRAIQLEERERVAVWTEHGRRSKMGKCRATKKRKKL